MRSEEEMRKVANYCERTMATRLRPFHPLIDFYHGVQRGLSWALGDIDEAWADMEAEIKRDIHPDEFASEEVERAIEKKTGD